MAQQITAPDAAHTLQINDDVFPGLAFFSGGVRGYNYRVTQEPRTFRTYVYYSGFNVPVWQVQFQVWEKAQLDEALRLESKYAPSPVKKLIDLEAVSVVNPYLNQQGLQDMLINNWRPLVTPKDGSGLLWYYGFDLIEAYPRRFTPKARVGSSANKGNMFDMPLITDRAINPEKSLESEYDKIQAARLIESEVLETPDSAYKGQPPSLVTPVQLRQ